MTSEESAALTWLESVARQPSLEGEYAALILEAGVAPTMIPPAGARRRNARRPQPSPTVDEIVVWFNHWLRLPLTERERTLISEVVNHALKYPEDVFRANRTLEKGGVSS